MSWWRRLLRQGAREPRAPRASPARRSSHERPAWTPGGEAAFVHYDVPGDFRGEVLRTDARPPGDVAVQLLRRGEHDAWLDHLLEGAAGAELVRRDPAIARQVERAPTCLQVRGHVADPPDLAHLQAVERLIDAALEAGGVAVRDEVALRGYAPADWRREVSASPEPVAVRHVAILATPGEGGVHLRTRGAAKVGRPDLDAGTVPEEDVTGVLELLNGLLARQVAGQILPDQGAIEPLVALPGLRCEAIRYDAGVLHVRVTQVT